MKMRTSRRALLLAVCLIAGSGTALASYNAAFVSESVATNTQEPPGSIFTQTWTMQNTGTTTWPAGETGCTMRLVGKDTLGAIPLTTNTQYTLYVPLAVIGAGKSVAAGGQATFSLNFIAPQSVGTYTDTFQMYNGSGVAFGPQVTVQIVIAQSGPPGQVLDRSKAISYANNYDGYIVSDGYFWNNGSTYEYYGAGNPVPTSFLGDDCAHFCSSCIGSPPNGVGGGMNIPSRVPPTYGEPGAARLVDTVLIAPGYATEVFSLTNMEPGDLIGWNWEGDTNIEDLDHVTLYVGNGMVASHAVSALDVSATTYFQSGEPDWVWHLIHIYDAVVISGSAPALQAVQMSQYGAFTFNVTGTAGANYAIQSSTDLVNWTQVGKTVTNAPTTVSIILGTSPGTTACFYRAVVVP
jgi:cell wall-associated NlpC family hydrolase